MAIVGDIVVEMEHCVLCYGSIIECYKENAVPWLSVILWQIPGGWAEATIFKVLQRNNCVSFAK